MNIVILDGQVLNPGDNPWTPLEHLGTCTIYDHTPPELVVERARYAAALFVNKTRITSEILDALPLLRYIGVLATGYDVVDVKAAEERGIPVCNVVAYGVDAVAQHVFALMLELARSTTLHSATVRAGQWTQSGDWCYWLYPPLDLADMTMGIAGFGNIGRRVGELAHAFGMKVQAYNRSTVPAPDYSPFAFVGLDELFATSDVVSLHMPLTDQTRHLVNAGRLAAMKPGALLINTARGPLLDEEAVAQALLSGQLGGLGADVLAKEPPELDNPLLTAPRCLITPHMSWATLRARRNIIRLAAENLHAWMDGTPRNMVNTPRVRVEAQR